MAHNKTITIDNNIIITIIKSSEKVADRGAVLLTVVGMSVALEMIDSALCELRGIAGGGSSVTRATLAVVVVLQSTGFRNPTRNFSSLEGFLQIKFRSPKGQSQSHGLLSTFTFSSDDETSVAKQDSGLSLARYSLKFLLLKQVSLCNAVRLLKLISKHLSSFNRSKVPFWILRIWL